MKIYNLSKNDGYAYCQRNNKLDSVRNILLIINGKYRDGLLFDNKTSREYILANNTWDALREVVLRLIYLDNCA